jgi:Protein of unknown function (DUF3800)
MRPVKYRLYIDEVGNPGLRAGTLHPNERYLSLTGVVAELDHVDQVMAPELDKLKRRYFESHADEPVVLHRKEIVNKKHPFQSLRDPSAEEAFNADLLRLLESLEYRVITIVIDKQEHLQRYQVWRYHPYHYCQEVLLERYVLFLERLGAVGDVMAESRGGKEDRRLKDAFHGIWKEGSSFVSADLFVQRLTSSQLKVKPKANNIAGLQLADLLAHPSFKAMLCRIQDQPLPENFGAKVAQILLDSKYHRSPRGKIDGWGCKWLP